MRSQKTGDLELLGKNQIDRLVLSGGTGDDGQFSLADGSTVHTLVIGDRSGALSIDSKVSRLEVTGDNQSIRLNHSVDELVVGGSRCDIQFGPSVTIGSVRFTDTSSQNSISLSHDSESISLDGQDNRIETSAKVGNLDLYGKRNKLTGTGSVDRATFHTKLSSTDLPCAESSYQLDEGIQNAILSLDAPQLLPIGETLRVTASFQNAEERLCNASWVVNGATVKTEEVLVGPSTGSSSYSRTFEYSRDMNTTCKVQFILRYETADETIQTIKKDVSVTLENYS